MIIDVSVLMLAVNTGGVITAALTVGIIGLIIGILLGVAGSAFHVEVDEREIKVRECLPGNNCGGCGFAGCDALAKAIASGEAKVNACPVGQDAVAKKIAKIMGVEAEKSERKVAYVKCGGTCDKAETKYNYYGIHDCRKLALIPGNGDKECINGCLGYGSCQSVCSNDAIKIVNGVAIVDSELCGGCGLCVSTCPKGIIELVPYEATTLVRCSSTQKGKKVIHMCITGCIGCTLCSKTCENDAISIVDNLARIDYSKCTGCGKCVDKCPAGAIVKK